MSDLIDRQAAIDAIDTGNLHRGIVEALQNLISELPSAEQKRERGRWERHYSRPNVFADLFWHCSCCGYKNDDQYANVYHKFCPHCGADMRGGNNALDAVADESCALTIEPHKWISCSERLPETDMCRTLTTICTPYKGTNVRSGCFYRGLFMNDNGDTWNATDKEVLAWMPLPEPYKEGGEDGNQTE